MNTRDRLFRGTGGRVIAAQMGMVISSRAFKTPHVISVSGQDREQWSSQGSSKCGAVLMMTSGFQGHLLLLPGCTPLSRMDLFADHHLPWPLWLGRAPPAGCLCPLSPSSRVHASAATAGPRPKAAREVYTVHEALPL